MDIFKSIIAWFTGICFIVILFPVAFIIWLIVLPFDRRRMVTHWILAYQSLILSSILPIWKVKISGREKIDRNATYVIISNHQSLLDILLINSLGYKYRWISKIENMKVPVVGWYLRMAGYLTVRRGDEESKEEMLEKALGSLKEGISIMIFPEGTRSPDGEIGFFKRGAFLLALQANVPILPVLIDGTSDILPKHGLKIGNGFRVYIKVLNPVAPSDFSTDDPDVLAGNLNLRMKNEMASLRTEQQ